MRGEDRGVREQEVRVRSRPGVVTSVKLGQCCQVAESCGAGPAATSVIVLPRPLSSALISLCHIGDELGQGEPGPAAGQRPGARPVNLVEQVEVAETVVLWQVVGVVRLFVLRTGHGQVRLGQSQVTPILAMSWTTQS